MSKIWHSDSRFDYMLRVEKAVAKAQADFGIIPKKDSDNIQKKSKFKVDRILEIEKTTKHDVIAFVSAVAENVGPSGRYIHYGMTSSDVIDTALSLQVQESWKILCTELKNYEKALRQQIVKHGKTLCAGRTHGMHAEPTTFGFKLAGFLQEHLRNSERLKKAIENLAICKLSGAVGTYSSQPEKVEKRVAKYLKLQPENLATQVIPRDRHAEVLNAIALIGGQLERLAVELRHLQRTEVGEVYEGFSKGQKGSSAMPHKKNPISSENITGQARLLRSYALVGLENIALWHERDISHSCTERVSFADAFILVDYCLSRMAGVIRNLQVDKKRMLQNMDLSQGSLFSSHVLLALVEKGIRREEAYKMVQSLAHGLKAGEHLKNKCCEDSNVQKLLGEKKIKDIFSGKTHISAIEKKLAKVLKR